MELMRELLEATNRPKPKKVVAKEPDSPFEKELEALRSRKGGPGRKSDLTDKDIQRLKDLEALEYSESDPPAGNKEYIPAYGPCLIRDLPTRRDMSVWLIKVTIYEEFVGNTDDFDSGSNGTTDKRDVGGNGTPRTPRTPNKKKGGGGDKKVQLKVQVVSDYYNKNLAKYDKFFDNTKSGYIEASEYFLSLLRKLS